MSMPSVHVSNYGCSANLAEAEAIKGVLVKEKRYSLAEQEDADVLVLNLCTVKGDHQSLRAVRQAREKNPNAKIVVTGCVTRTLREQVQKQYPDVNITNTNNLHLIQETVAKTLDGESVIHIAGAKEQKANLPRIRTNPVISIIPISTGCLSTCSYCSTKQVKGILKSYPLTTIKKEFDESLREGCKEFWLTSQDNGCWGYDIGMNPAVLLKELSHYRGDDEEQKDYRIRYGMTSPQHFLKDKEAVLEAFHNERVYKFLHLPVQSGSDNVLKGMKRDYTAEEYEQLVQDIKKEHPTMTIATDIIVGYPSESDDDFEQTIGIIKNTHPHISNISRFARREGTTSAQLHTLPSEIVQERSRIVSALCEDITQEHMEEMVGKTVRVLANNHLRFGTTQCRSNNYSSIVLPETVPLGTFHDVKITGVGRKYCKGTLSL